MAIANGDDPATFRERYAAIPGKLRGKLTMYLLILTRIYEISSVRITLTIL
jgi:hypothetical protein